MTEYCVIYHANCSDGFGAAWAIWRELGDSAIYIPGIHGNLPPEEITGKHVIVVDFSYPKSVLLEIKRRAKSLLVLDHHKSAERELGDLEFAIFDMERSGAGMAWDHFHKSNRPELINYIEDRDLWRWLLPNSKEILAAFEVVEHNFNEFDEFNSKLESSDGRRAIIDAGEVLCKYRDKRIKSLVEKAYIVDLAPITGVIDLQIPCVNTPLFHSEVGNILAQNAPVAMTWYKAEDGMCRHSLRSNGKVDCSVLAAKFGGGGHPNAAGFTISEPFASIKKNS